MSQGEISGSCGQVNPVTRDYLRRAIDELYRYHESKNAPARGKWAFHNDDLYRPLETWRRLGLDRAFWDYLVCLLWNWRAIRPKSKEAVGTKGLAQLSDLQRCFAKLAGDGSHELPTFETLAWEDVSPLFEVAQGTKGGNRPTFGSKLCHFLVPSAYIVWDNQLVKAGGSDYETYWKCCRQAWLASREQDACKCLLRDQIVGAGSIPCETYPWATKITELCQHIPASGPR
jgi:hypothetical protein